jgi:flagellar protein FlbD
MIKLTRFDGTVFVLNSDIIQYIESTPDTIITLTTGDKVMVREKVEDVIKAVIEFKQTVFTGILKLKRSEDIDYIE